MSSSPALLPTLYINSDSPDIIRFTAQAIKGLTSDKEKAVKLYYTVRDEFPYDAHGVTLDPEKMKASFLLKNKKGFCIQKAILYAALLRASGIPARLGFSDVKNHLASEKMIREMRTDIFYFHGYTEVFLDGKWIKATPAFNKTLCERFGVSPLDFDGEHDSVFHSFDKEGKKFMTYLHEYGSYDDLPYDLMCEVMKKSYPHFFGDGGKGWPG